MCGILENVIEERMMEVREERGQRFKWMTYIVPQGSAKEVLREAIPHGGVQSQLHVPVSMERKSSTKVNPFLRHMMGPGKMDASRFHWTTAEERRGARYNDNG